MVKHYTRDSLTVTWKPDLCKHSTNCWRGLSAVFDPRKSPWIDMDAAEIQQIIAQVKQCPSGALTYTEATE